MSKELIRSGILKIAQAKYTPEQVNYREADDPSKACGMCGRYAEEDASKGACTLVEGEVEAFMVCDKYTNEKASPEVENDRDMGSQKKENEDD